MRVVLMHNAGAGDDGPGEDELTAALRRAGHEVGYQSMDDPSWPSAVRGDADLVVAAGGDGTVGAVFRAMPGAAAAGTLLPLGSANNIARTLGIAGHGCAELARGWETAIRRPYDVCILRRDGDELRVVESMGGGVFAEVLARAERSPDDPSGEDSRRQGLELLAAVIDEEPARPWLLALDGVDLSGDYLVVEAMNVREIGPNLPLAPEADPGDGLIDVVVAGEEHRPALAAWVRARLDGRPAPALALPCARGRALDMRAPDGCPLHADDHMLAPAPEAAGEARLAAGTTPIQLVLPA